MTARGLATVWCLVLLAMGLSGPAVLAQDSKNPPSLEVTDLAVDPESDPPLACISFNERLAESDGLDWKTFVRIDPDADIAITARRNFLCLEGLKHGERYDVTLKAGLAGTTSALADDVPMQIVMPDRAPTVSFAAGDDVLPRIGVQGLPVTTVNVPTVALKVFRINERAIAARGGSDLQGGEVYSWTLDDLENESGELLWSGEMDIAGTMNQDVRTAIPLNEVIGTLEPGLYVATALDARRADDDYPAWASQPFMVSNLGVATALGDSGLDVTVRSLADATPLAGVTLELIARNDAVLGTIVTDADGYARFDPGMVRGTGGNRPKLVTATDSEGDYVYVDLAAAPIDLSDRGVSGRAPSGPLDAYLYAERGIYRPGETAHITAILRDENGAAASDLPLTFRVLRPDGQEVLQRTSSDDDDGGHLLTLDIAGNAYTGTWTVEAYVDPDGARVGQVNFLVDDFVPPRIEVDMSASPDILSVKTPEATVDVEARFLYGSPAGNLAAELSQVVAKSVHPFAELPDYYFGLAEENVLPRQLDDIAFTTDDAGQASLSIQVPPDEGVQSPVELQLRATVFDVGGRPVSRELTLPIVKQPMLLGIRPNFDDDRAPWGQPAEFDVIAVDWSGQRIDKSGLQWDLFREQYDWVWYEDDQWQYRGVLYDRHIASGRFDAAADTPARIGAEIDWGWFRLEVYDAETGIASSYRFRGGWSHGVAGTDGTPDAVTVTLSEQVYAPGDTAAVFVQPPFDAEVEIAVMDSGVRDIMRVVVPEEGMEISLPVEATWSPGVYVVATAYNKTPMADELISRRAIGAVWMAVEQPDQRLAVTIDAPASIEPSQTLSVPIEVTGQAADTKAFVTLAAVDDGILQLTRFDAPDPASYLLDQRRLGVDLRDIYGRLIDPSASALGQLRSGGGMMRGAGVGSLPQRSSKVVSLFSGIVETDADGRAVIELDIPDFNGRLKLMAVAWTVAGVGATAVDMTVAAPVVADLSLPRFLAPGDRAWATLAVDNVSGTPGQYSFQINAGGAVTIIGATQQSIDLAVGDGTGLQFELIGAHLGVADIQLTVTGPDDYLEVRSWGLTVRPSTRADVTRVSMTLDPGVSDSVSATLSDGLYPESVVATIGLNTVPAFDVKGLLDELAAYGYACAEQTTSRALPLLYFSSDGTLGPDDVIDNLTTHHDVDEAVRSVLAMQRPDGTFGYWWWYNDTNLWLSAYVMDFLVRARERGVFVPQFGYDRGIKALQRAVSDWRDESGELAYAYYVLARSGNSDLAELEYFATTHYEDEWFLDEAFIAASFDLLGDPERAAEVAAGINPTLADLQSHEWSWRYRSVLTDLAAATAVLGESRSVPAAKVLGLAQMASEVYATRQWISTHEEAWMLLAARSLDRFTGEVQATLGGETIDQSQGLSRDLAWPPAGGSLAVANQGDKPLYATVTVRGYPMEAPPARENGFSIERRVYDMAGNPIDPSTMAQHDLAVIVLTGELKDRIWWEYETWHDILLIDLLPAGLEIENARLEGNRDLENLAWLGDDLSPTDNVEQRDDQYAAALSFAGKSGFKVAYIVRAVTPGNYVYPAPYVEDMYRPYQFALGKTGTLDVTGN